MYKHVTFESAKNEAKRLTEKYNLKSYVLGTIVSFRVPDKFVTEECNVTELENLPF